jgi:hypothetical protein
LAVVYSDTARTVITGSIVTADASGNVVFWTDELDAVTVGHTAGGHESLELWPVLPPAAEILSRLQGAEGSIAAIPSDAGAGTPSLRSLGTTSTKAAAGNDSRFAANAASAAAAQADVDALEAALPGTYPGKGITETITGQWEFTAAPTVNGEPVGDILRERLGTTLGNTSLGVDGTTIHISASTEWGVRGDGTKYYRPNGSADAGEEAVFGISETGRPYIAKIDPAAPSLLAMLQAIVPGAPNDNTTLPKAPGRTPAAGVSALSAPADHVHGRHGVMASDGSSGYVGWSFDPAPAALAGSAVASGQSLGVEIPLPGPATLTGIDLWSVTAPGSALTTGQCFVALYAGTVLLAVSSDQAASWTTGTGRKQAVFTSPAHVTASAVRVVWWSVGGGTQPSWGRGANSASVNVGRPAGSQRFFTADASLTTTAPSPLGTLASSSLAWWAALVGSLD